MSSHTVASRGWCGSRFTTTSTVSASRLLRLEKQIMLGWSTKWNRRLRNQCRAGWDSLIMLRRVRNGAMPPGSRSASFQSRGR